MQCMALTRNTYGDRGKRQGQIPKVIQALNYAAYQALRYIRPESEPFLVEKFAQLTAAGYPGLDPALVGTKNNGNSPPVRIGHPVSRRFVQTSMACASVLSTFIYVRLPSICRYMPRVMRCAQRLEALQRAFLYNADATFWTPAGQKGCAPLQSFVREVTGNQYFPLCASLEDRHAQSGINLTSAVVFKSEVATQAELYTLQRTCPVVVTQERCLP